MFKFEHIVLLLCLPLPLLWQYFVKPRELRSQSALMVPFFTELKSIPKTVTRQLHSGKYLIGLWMIWFALVFAAANPIWVGAPIAINREARNILLAVDISGSMEIQDMQWKGRSADRLFVVKQLAKEFIDHRQGDRLGLILFGTNAYLQTPLTFDLKTVWAMLDDATVGLAGPQTAMGDALGLAIKKLSQMPKEDRVLVLLTDGASNAGAVSPEEAAAMAQKNAIKIYTIGLGANQLVVHGLFQDEVVNPSADLDEALLKKIALLTHGKYFRATSTAELKEVYQTLDELEPVVTDKSMFRPQTCLYPWLLGFALCIALLMLVFGLIGRRGYDSFYQT
jgi:Ca-activated chloride channel family protein